MAFHKQVMKAADLPVRDLALVFCVVLLASLFGILTRPIGLLAAVWPANAILLGMMVRNPALSTPLGWGAAFAGYVAADMVTGNALGVTLWLTSANIAGALTAYALLMRLRPADRRLQHPSSVVYLFGTCAAAAGIAALVGGGAALVLFDRDPFVGFAFWFTTELVNMIAFLPVIMTWPPRRAWSRGALRKAGRHDWVPAVALAASTLGALLAGGPGAFAYPIPALLWCALAYPLFATAVLTLCFSTVQLIGVSAGLLSVAANGDELMTSVSMRLAIALIALGPLAVGSINAAREELVRRLQHTANHDGLTDALTRTAFLKQARRMLDTPAGDGRHAAVLMLDLDRFKSINDGYGHAVGDRVLIEASQAIRGALRPEDLFGRMGGEEFAILLTGLAPADARAAAERIRRTIERLAFDVEGIRLHVTVSIGLASNHGEARELRDMLIAADRAVYAAKDGGRNRVVAEDVPHPAKGHRTAA